MAWLRATGSIRSQAHTSPSSQLSIMLRRRSRTGSERALKTTARPWAAPVERGVSQPVLQQSSDIVSIISTFINMMLTYR